MKIYDYYENYYMATFVFILLTAIAVFFLTFLIINCVNAIKKSGINAAIILVFVAIIVVLVLLAFFSYNVFTLIKFDMTCASGNYESVSGPIENIDIQQTDYRGEELYNIEFVIDNMHFKEVANSFSPEQKTLITNNLEKDFEIRYSYVGKELVIYQIIICEDQ